MSEILTNNDLSFTSIFIGILCCFVCGIILAITYSFKNRLSKNMILALILIPIIVHVLIIVINGNLGTSVAVLGTFSLVRFRSAQGNSKDITFIFLAMVIGICCGLGYYYMSPIITSLSCIIAIAIKLVPISLDKEKRNKYLKITIPDDVNYEEEFNPIFEKYTNSCELTSIRTTQLGSLYVLQYNINLKEKNIEKQLIDELRIKNSNLPIVCNSNIELSENTEKML